MRLIILQNKRFLIPALLIALFALSLPALAQSQSTVILTDQQGEYPIGLNLEILEDTQAVWTIEDVTSPEISSQFVVSQEETLNLGFTDSAYWIRFRVRNEADLTTKWLLLFGFSAYYLDVYTPSLDSQGYNVIHTGTALPFNTREIDHPQFLFNLPFATGSEETIYVRLESESRMILPLSIWSAATVAQNDLVEQMLRGFLYGVLLIMIVYNLFVFLFLRDRSYLYYVLLFLFALILVLFLDGVGHQYLWPDWGKFNAFIGQMSFAITMIFTLKFSGSFLDTAAHTPRLNKIITILIVILAAAVLLQLVSVRLAAMLVMPATVVGFIVMTIAGLVIWRQGNRSARYFVSGLILFLADMAIFVLMIFGVLPLSRFTEGSFRLGLVVLSLVFAIALAERINSFRQKKEAAQLEVLHKQQEAIQLKDEHARAIEEMNESLTVEFEQRARELSFAQEQLNTLFEGSPLAIGTADLDGNILSANEAMAQMFGYSDEEILGANVNNFFPDKEVRQEVNRRLRQGKIVKVPMLQLRRKDGTLFYANLIENILKMADQEVLLGIVDDITEQVLAEQTLQAQAEETAVVAERTRIAMELHDSVTQTLYTTSLIAEALPAVWETQPDEARQSLGELRNLTVGALAEMRTLLLELHPGTLVERPLSELLHQLADAMSTRTEMPITTTVVGKCSAPEDVQKALYRIAQESLNNITKHARASRAWVNLNCVTNGVTLRIGDNGRGFDPLAHQPHELGLDIMYGRAEAIGAEFSITSEKNQGTEIVVEWAGAQEINETLNGSFEEQDNG